MVEHLGDFLSVGGSMLAQFLPEASSVHNASLPVSAAAAADPEDRTGGALL